MLREEQKKKKPSEILNENASKQLFGLGAITQEALSLAYKLTSLTSSPMTFPLTDRILQDRLPRCPSNTPDSSLYLHYSSFGSQASFKSLLKFSAKEEKGVFSFPMILLNF